MKKFYLVAFLVVCLLPSFPQAEAVEATAVPQQQNNVLTQTSEQKTSVNQDSQQKQGSRDIVFDQVKKNCNDLAKAIDTLDLQLRSEEFLNQNITIVELSELINRVQEDIKTRINELDRNDKVEILKIIKEKEQTLLKQVKDMEILLRPQKQSSSWKKKALIAGEIIVGVSLLLTLLLATYDNHHDEWSLPSWENVRYNFSLLFDLDVIPAPTPIQPRPVTSPAADKAPASADSHTEDESPEKDSDHADVPSGDEEGAPVPTPAEDGTGGHTGAPVPAPRRDLPAEGGTSAPVPAPVRVVPTGDGTGGHEGAPIPAPRRDVPAEGGTGSHEEAHIEHDGVPEVAPEAEPAGGSRAWYNPARYIWGVNRPK